MERGKYDTDQWHLVGGWRRGLGRSWLGWVYSAEDDPLDQASSNLPALKRWLRTVLAADGVPGSVLRYHSPAGARNSRLTFVYAPRRYYPDV